MTVSMMQTGAVATARTAALAGVEAWLEGCRGPGGYGGPVAHWWQHALRFTGPGLDWRYEGILHGYLTLFARDGNPEWLRRAQRAADDLTAGQLPGGSFRNSRFELNPGTLGTPHEPGAVGGLLRLAAVLRRRGEPDWARYRDCGVRYLRQVALERLWRPDGGWFSDTAGSPSFVPNKAATMVEALLAWEDLEPGAVDLERYVVPTLDAILTLQVRRSGSPLDGGIAQIRLVGVTAEKYFPMYAARCVPALLEGARRFNRDRYLEAAASVIGFVTRWTKPDGAQPLAVYPDGRANEAPLWVAAAADVLRAGLLLREAGPSCDLAASEAWFLGGQQGNGSFVTARGFAAAPGGGARSGPPDLLDCLPAAGWNDKAFRYLALTAPPPPAPASPPPLWETPCRHRGRDLVLHEDGTALWATEGDRTVYSWEKGSPWASVAEPWLWQR